jgi:hypothetical protein
VRLHRPPEQVALAIAAAQPAQAVQLLFGLDAFGHHDLAQAAAEQHDRAHHGLFGVAAVQARHEAAVDLQAVQRQRRQVRQRRIAGAEVVDGQQHAEPLELGQCAQRAFHARHQDVLGELDAQVLRRHARFHQRPRHARHQRRVGDVVARDVDVHRQCGMGRRGLLPGLELAAGAVKHEVGHAHHQPGFLGDGQEAAGRDGAVLRVVPAHQGLEAREAWRRGICRPT